MPTSIRVMSFNIRGAQHKDGLNLWSRRSDLNLSTIRRAAADVIGFQEVEQENLLFYQTHLPEYDLVVGNPQELHEPYGYGAIFWRPDRFEQVDASSFWLSPTPDQHGRAWGAQCVRAATWLRLRSHETGAEFIHLNTHLDHISQWARVEGARLILRRLQELPGDPLPTILTGDFNTSPWRAPGEPTETYRLFRAGGFTDAWLDAGNDDWAASHTFHGFQGPDYARDNRGSARIDWILLRDGDRRLETVSCAILRDAEPPLYPSDHYPVLADLMLVP